jgi:hypothetical protein
LSVDLNDRFFDLTMKIVNYSLEFVDQPSYASLRLADVLESLVSLSSSIEGVDRREFYGKVYAKLRDRIDAEDRSALLNDILSLYIDEWRRSDSH